MVTLRRGCGVPIRASFQSINSPLKHLPLSAQFLNIRVYHNTHYTIQSVDDVNGLMVVMV